MICTYVVTSTICDGCGVEESNQGVVSDRRQVREARRIARVEGWTFKAGRDLCPGCSR